MESENTSICKMCCMTINARAKKCPYCQHFQNKWSMIAFHPLFVIIPIIIVIATMGTLLQNIFSKGEPFSQYISAVSAIETRMVFGVSGCEHTTPTVAILGKIKNDSPISWKNISLEACFFDRDGQLIDATQQGKYSFTTPAQDESAFKLSFSREFPEDKYVTFKVRVVSAKDERTRF